MNIVIVGAQLANKGAESMLYITVDELKKRFDNCNVYFATSEEFDDSMYAFHRLYHTSYTLDIACGGVGAIKGFVYGTLKDSAKIILRKKEKWDDIFAFKKIIKKTDLIIDISGFALGDKWNESTHIFYLKNIEVARKYNIPMYLMPQSFGPFNYHNELVKLLDKMQDLLQYPKKIFAREKEGYSQLVNTFGLENVVLSSDLVLQNRGICIENIFVKNQQIDVPSVRSKKVVGIVPNVQCFRHGDENKNIKIYKEIINKLVSDNFDVVIFRHSRDDLKVCKMIYEQVKQHEKVELEEKEFSCLEYDEYVKQFSFIIASRFHGIVHAYRNGIPCIALGWAVKYQELAKRLEQDIYSIDITLDMTTIESVLSVVERMGLKYKEEKNIIFKNLREIQKDNCFSKISI